MLKSINRLKKDTDFQAVWRSGKRTACGDLAILVMPNSTNQSRCGVVVSKKISRNAVNRNRIRRIILSELSELLYQGTLPTGSDIVVRVLRLPQDIDNSQAIRIQLRECFAKLS
ncbi:MAG: ribonuclease P protein component [Patescibacteria group bacterium]